MKKFVLATASIALLLGSTFGVAAQNKAKREARTFLLWQRNFALPRGADVVKMVQVPRAKLVAPKGTANKLFYLLNQNGDILGVVNNKGQFFGWSGTAQPNQVNIRRLMLKSPKGLKINFLGFSNR